MAQNLPHFLPDVRADAAQHLHEVFRVGLRAAPVLVARVHEDHHLADGRVEAQAFKVAAHLFHRLVENLVQGAVAFRGDVLFVREECPHPVQEFPRALNSLGAPGFGNLQRTHEHFVKPQRVRAVLVHDVAGVHNVFREPLAHLDAVFAQDHPLMHQLFEGLLHRAQPLVVQVPVPDPAVHQVPHRVLRSADVKIHRQPVLQQFIVGKLFVVVRVDVAHVVPAASRAAGHGAGFPLAFDPVLIILFPFDGVFQGRLSVLSFIILQLRQHQRQLLVRQGEDLPVFRVNHRHRFAPVPLPREDPFAEMIVHRPFRDAHLFELRGDGFLGLFHGQPCEFLAVDQPASLAEVVLLLEGVFAHICPVDNLDHRDSVGNGVFKVPLVVARNGHDRACAIAGQYEIADEQLRFFSVGRVDALHALQAAAGLALVQLRPIHIVLLTGFRDIGLNLFFILNPGHQILNQLPVRCQHHERNAVDCFDTGGENAEFAAADDLELHLNAFALADPVALHVLRALRPVDLLQPFQQLLREGRLVDHPLLHVLPDHRISAAFALPVDHFVVGKHRPQLFAPVYRHVDVLGVSVQEQLFENPLGPFVEFRIAGGDHLAPVVVEPQLLQLFAEGFDVLFREALRMIPGLDGILLRRQAEAVVAHGVQHIVSLHPLHPAHDVRRRVAFRMARVQAHAAGIRKHIQRVKFRFAEVVNVRPERFMIFPVFLPFLFDNLRVVAVFHAHSPDPYKDRSNYSIKVLFVKADRRAQAPVAPALTADRGSASSGLL